MSQIECVTAFMDLGEDRYSDGMSSIDRYFEYFYSIAKSGIPIRVFLQPHLIDRLNTDQYPNVIVSKFVFETLDIYNWVNAIPDLELPPTRNIRKDTKQYLIMMNAKIEFIRRAMAENTTATHFVWVDFGIAHVFRDIGKAQDALRQLSASILVPTCLHFPGCWNLGTGMQNVYNNVVWRFSGGSFLGDRQSLHEMWDLYAAKFVDIITKQKRLVWEVNIWAILEQQYGLKVTWHYGGHDERLVMFPQGLMSG
jgi:hypothetical protein